MIITYNGKEYICKTYSDGKVELRSKKYEDDTFKNVDGIYIKYVDISECENLKYTNIFAVYNNESIEVWRMDSDRNQLLLFAATSYGYSKEFINNVLGGQEGRDIDAWCDIDVLSSFFMITRDYVTKEKKEIILDREQAKEFITLMRLQK